MNVKKIQICVKKTNNASTKKVATLVFRRALLSKNLLPRRQPQQQRPRKNPQPPRAQLQLPRLQPPQLHDQ